MVSPEIWERLDHRAGMLTRRQAWRWRAVAAAGVATVLLVLAGWSSGALFPRVEESGLGNSSVRMYQDELGRPTGLQGTVSRYFHNQGHFPVTVTGVGVEGAGLTVTSAGGEDGRALPLTIPAGQGVSLSLGLVVTDCDAATSSGPRVVLEVDRWWGSVAVRPETVGDSFHAADLSCR
ncbi:hypothetical protein ACIBK9_45515 [Nonomuraea sp. NPDC050227]|uniref:hypothetical protein n=1 Tax=Nonomuraea sp. NPDC050227 TaxID=3364360 RepID=UPI003799D8D4